MECNKDEAIRAKTLAEVKMQKNDFVGAHKFVMKAQRLFPDLENLPKMLAVCDVHIAAEKTISGLVNWYGILQVMHFDEIATIKQQYRKLALLLHPDKNQFAGAEAAFKLVWEASRLLFDKEKRSDYDIRHRIHSRTANRQMNANSGQQCAAANNTTESGVPTKASTAVKPKAEVTEPETGASKSVTDESVSKTGQAPSMSKNKTKIVEEPIESVKVEVSDDILEGKVYSKDNKRRSSRKRQQNSYADEGISDDFISPATKRSRSRSTSRSRVELKSDRTTEKQNLGVGSSKRLDSGKEQPLTHESPDPEFNSFELTTSSFAVNQVWSLYDSTDGMPRFYARIDKVLYNEFKLWITWIDPVEDNKDGSVPIACGIFQDGDSKEVDDHLIFSCQMFHFTHNNNIIIYPRKGEIWGVFRGWDISWNASSENHKRPYEYDYVEILSNYNDENGLGVAYLGKVEGFVSLFRREAQHGFLQLQISPSEMLRFSHKVPSFKMTGNEREGVPHGCFELDTAALPKDLFEVDNPKTDGERRDDESYDPFPEVNASCKGVKAVDDLRKYGQLSSETNNRATSKSSQKTAEKKSPRESLSQFRGNSFLTRLKSAFVPSSSTTRQKQTFNFENKRSCDKFKIDQIWAVYSNDNKGIPRKYVQIKIIDTKPDFKLFVAPLKLSRTPEFITHPVSCGRFKLKTCKAEVLVPSNFSHQIKAVKIGSNRFEVYPEKGEIWALYKNTTGCAEEFEIVEVVETDEEKIQVMVLTAKGYSKCYYERRLDSKAGFVEIPKVEASKRFSHQIPAFRHEGRLTRFGDGDCWELDPKALLQ